jgi:hypothetical protein
VKKWLGTSGDVSWFNLESITAVHSCCFKLVIIGWTWLILTNILSTRLFSTSVRQKYPHDGPRWSWVNHGLNKHIPLTPVLSYLLSHCWSSHMVLQHLSLRLECQMFSSTCLYTLKRVTLAPAFLLSVTHSAYVCGAPKLFSKDIPSCDRRKGNPCCCIEKKVILGKEEFMWRVDTRCWY